MNHNSTLSAYAYNISQGCRLGEEYIRLSIEALGEDDKEIEKRRFTNQMLEEKCEFWLRCSSFDESCYGKNMKDCFTYQRLKKNEK